MHDLSNQHVIQKVAQANKNNKMLVKLINLKTNVQLTCAPAHICSTR